MKEFEYFSEGFICNLESTDKKEAIQELIKKLPVFKPICDCSEFEKEVILREKRQSTGLGHGVAIAHGQATAKSIRIGLGVSCKGIQYGSVDNKPVSLLFMIANPPEKQQEYLKVLSALVKLLRNPEFREKVIALDTWKEKEVFIRNSFSSQLSEERPRALSKNYA